MTGEPAIRELRFAASPTDGGVSALVCRPPDCRALLVLGHGAGAGMRHRFMEGIARSLANQGVGTFRYQFPYAEAGRRRPDRTHTLTATVRAAAATAREMEPDLPLLAGGKSMGGRMTSTTQAESSLPGVRGLVFFGFPLHRPGEASDARADHLAEIDLPLLFLQGTRDRLAELERIRRVVERSPDRSTLFVVEDGDHGFDVLKRTGKSTEQVYEEMAAAVAAWLGTIQP